MGVDRDGRSDLHAGSDLWRNPWMARLAALAVVLAVWEIAARLVDRPVLPPATEVLRTLAQEAAGGLAVHAATSLYRVLASIGLAVATAVPAGLVLGQSRRLNRLLEPFVYLLYPVPKVVLVPVLLVVLGVGDLPKIAIVTLILFFQVLVLVRDAAAGIRRELLLSVRSLGAGRRALFRFVYLPASLPAVLTAVRQSIGTAIAVLYVAELFATRHGLGYYIYLQGSTLYNYPAMYGGVIVMGLLGVGLYSVVDAAERRLIGGPDTHS